MLFDFDIFLFDFLLFNILLAEFMTRYYWSNGTYA